jgi:hypothetical protein
MQTIWEGMKQESDSWSSRMKYFHKHRRPIQRRFYEVKEYLFQINTKKDIKMVKEIKKGIQ